VTEIESQRLWTVLLAAYPSASARLDAQAIRDTGSVYRRMLADLEYPEANAAIERLIATSKWLPTVAEIREAAVTVATGEVRSGGEAWGDVLQAVRRFGYQRRPEFDDPVVAQCVSMLGWGEICMSENQTADRARFIDLYDQLAGKHRREHIAGHLPAATRLRELRSGDARSAGSLIGRVFGHLNTSTDGDS
jgi:hypothetical protein